jgi:hypothetical protein
VPQFIHALKQLILSRRTLAIIAIVYVGAALRFELAARLSPDWDEDDYLAAAADFRDQIEAGNLSGLSNVETNFEHPPLTKILYALGVDATELDTFHREIPRFSRWPQPPHSTYHARAQSATTGTLTILAVALVSPLAGLILAVQSIHLHYTSVAYLEAIPTLMSALAVIVYNTRKRGTFWLSAALFGVAVAGKYMYALAGIAILLHYLFVVRDDSPRKRVIRLAIWGAVSIAVFFACNPYLWRDPINRLDSQLSYFSEYATWYTERHTFTRPFEEMIATDRHFDELLTPEQLRPLQFSDFAFGLAAIPGLIVLLRRKSVYGIWLVLGFVFMSVWTAQWVQHRMMILVPYSLAAAAGFDLLRVAFWRGAAIFKAKKPDASDEIQAERVNVKV